MNRGKRIRGCGPKEDLSGRVFGRQRVLCLSKEQRFKRYGGDWLWDTRCNCGRVRPVSGNALKRGKTSSCKSCNVLDGKTPAEAAFGRLLGVYKQRAKRRGGVFALTKHSFKKKTSAPCFYTGFLPKTTINNTNGGYVYNGIDRRNSRVGYTERNTVPCNGTVNFMKNDSLPSTFIAFCVAVQRHCKKKHHRLYSTALKELRVMKKISCPESKQ